MIEFFFDCSSPWTWLAFHNIQPLAAEFGVPVRWRPILVGGIFNTVNPTMYEQRARPVPSKQAYMLKDLQDWARLAGLRIVMPPRVFPVNSVKAMRGCLWLAPQGLLVPFAGAVFEAYWSREEDISDDAVLEVLCMKLGIDFTDFQAGVQASEIRQQLRDNTDELVRRGGFGTPTMFVGDDMYFGNDRLVLLRQALLRPATPGATH